MSRVGFDNTLGFLKGGFQSWADAGKEIDQVESLEVSEILDELKEGKAAVFDVRKESEYEAEHLAIADNTPLDFINDHLAEFPSEKFYLHCASGYRSVIASSILKSRGIHNLVDVAGGFDALKESGLELTEFVCPSTK